MKNLVLLSLFIVTSCSFFAQREPASSNKSCYSKLKAVLGASGGVLVMGVNFIGDIIFDTVPIDPEDKEKASK